VGCWIGGCLATTGVPVTFIGRARVLDALRGHGLTLTDLDGGVRTVAVDRLTLKDAPSPADMPSLALLCVKSGATAAAAAVLGRVLPAGTLVVSMQNGISNAGAGACVAPCGRARWRQRPNSASRTWRHQRHAGRAGIVPALGVAADVDAAGAPALYADMAPLQWGKPLLNLNNPVNVVGPVASAQPLQRPSRLHGGVDRRARPPGLPASPPN
jgi:2-dehydropantoate 2-reductase